MFENGYKKLLTSLGNNLVSFLSNLNSLHLHLQATFPEMLAPSFRCENITPSSLELHYYSHRPALWPLAAGIIKGVATQIYELQPSTLSVDLISGRDSLEKKSDHEVLLIKFPVTMQERQRGEGVSQMPDYDIHPFHLLMDHQGCLIQSGSVLQRHLRNVTKGSLVDDHIKISHPHLNSCPQPFSSPGGWEMILQELHSPFLLTLVTDGGATLELKGQMFHHPNEKRLLFIGSPRCSNLDELKASNLFLSDLPLYDMSRDFILLAEQRSIEMELKEKLEKMTLDLRAEKARSDALVQRMGLLLNCFPFDGQAKDSSGFQSGSKSLAPSASQLAASVPLAAELTNQEVVEAVKQSINPQMSLPGLDLNQIVILEPLAEGCFGSVSRGLWQGVEVALKTIILPEHMSGGQKRERMIVMEAAISAALSHPNIIQTYTYTIRPLKGLHSKPDLSTQASQALDREELERQGIIVGGNVGSLMMVSCDSPSPPTASKKDKVVASDKNGFEMVIVMELCDLGSLRAHLDKKIFQLPDESLNYAAVLDVAIGICKALMHLHNQNIVHSDIKANNVMLKASGSGGVSAKLADFGLSVKVSEQEPEVKGSFQGTLTFMSPELISKGIVSKASDIYAYGIFLWEIYTADAPFKNCPRHLYNHLVTVEDKRPAFPSHCPQSFSNLVRWCWSKDPSSRPSIVEVLRTLQGLRKAIKGATPDVNLPKKVEKDELESDDPRIRIPSAAAESSNFIQEESSLMDSVYGIAPAGTQIPKGRNSIDSRSSRLSSRDASVLSDLRPASRPLDLAMEPAACERVSNLKGKVQQNQLPKFSQALQQPIASSEVRHQEVPEGMMMLGELQESQWL